MNDIISWLEEKLNDQIRVYVIFSEILDSGVVKYEKGKMDAYAEVLKKLKEQKD